MSLTDKKAQTSFEVLFIAAAIFILCVAIVSYFNYINSSTIAMAVMKTSTLKALNASATNFVIERIDFVEETDTRSIRLIVTTLPTTITCSEINADSAEQIILENNVYDSVSIVLNGNQC